MCVAAAIVGAGALGAVGSVVAGNKQAGAQEKASQTQLGMFNTIQQQNQPFLQAGYGATSKLTDLMGTSGNTGADGYGSLTSNFTPQDFLNNKDPGYDFQLKQGGQAIRNADTPQAGALSGSTLKDLIGFNQGMAATGYQNAFNRDQTQKTNIFARLSGIAGLGQNSANNTGVAGTALGTGAAQAQAGAGASQAGGIVGATNNLAGGGLAGLMYAGGSNTGSGVVAGGNGITPGTGGSGVNVGGSLVGSGLGDLYSLTGH